MLVSTVVACLLLPVQAHSVWAKALLGRDNDPQGVKVVFAEQAGVPDALIQRLLPSHRDDLVTMTQWSSNCPPYTVPLALTDHGTALVGQSHDGAECGSTLTSQHWNYGPYPPLHMVNVQFSYSSLVYQTPGAFQDFVVPFVQTQATYPTIAVRNCGGGPAATLPQQRRLVRATTHPEEETTNVAGTTTNDSTTSSSTGMRMSFQLAVGGFPNQQQPSIHEDKNKIYSPLQVCLYYSGGLVILCGTVDLSKNHHPELVVLAGNTPTTTRVQPVQESALGRQLVSNPKKPTVLIYAKANMTITDTVTGEQELLVVTTSVYCEGACSDETQSNVQTRSN